MTPPLPAPLARMLDHHRAAATITQVIDGDTIRVTLHYPPGIDVHSQTIRLYGIQAPELHSQYRHHAQASHAYLAELALNNPAVLEFTKSTTDKHGRWLAIVWVDSGGQPLCLNTAMILAGHAERWRPARHPGPARLPGDTADIPPSRKPSGVPH